MYSSGLPILYAVACIFNFVLYWMVKLLLLRYYQRTHKFNEELALESIKYFKFGLFFHIITGAFMYTNSAIISTSLGYSWGGQIMVKNKELI